MIERHHPPAPCADCPYRVDAPVGKWDRSEFQRLLAADRSQLGSIYACHSQAHLPEGQRGLCAGWLLDQKRRNVPSIRLRVALSRQDGVAAALDTVTDGGHELYPDVETMCRVNGVRVRR